MKNIFKVLAIIALVAVIGFLMACTDGDDGGNGNGGGSSQEPITYTGDSIADFAIWLAAQPANTKTRPYIVKLNVSDLGGDSYIDGSLGDVLRQNDTKYVSLDLSGSTFTSIEYAFQECESLTSITIPSSVTSIGELPFVYCLSLTAINVAAANTEYSSQDGVLYDKYKTTLIQCPGGKTGAVAIPNDVTSIGEITFAMCENLTSVTIPNSVTNIGREAFPYCNKLISVTFATGSNITDVNFGDSAFPPDKYHGGSNILKTAYLEGKAGTYKRNGDTWSKQ